MSGATERRFESGDERARELLPELLPLGSACGTEKCVYA
jgi:hypothetical protein